MAVRIRLRRPGKSVKGRYNFRIAVTDSRKSREGKIIEEVGYYNPSKKPRLLHVDLERIRYWIGKGARPTETVASLVKKFKKGTEQNT